MAKKTINAGAPPIVWSTVEQAFADINANFTELYSSIGGPGGIVDFSDLPTSLVPRSNEVYDLGTPANRWRVGFFSSDGISIGASNIEDDNGSIALPSGSTVGGQLIKDPAEVSFGRIAVSGQSTVVANSATSTLNFAGSGISITTNENTDTVTFTNSGVRTVSAGSGISLSGTANDPVINASVGGVAAGLGVSVSNVSGTYTVSNSGIVGLEAGLGITIGARDPVTGKVVITNQSPASGILSFRSITAPLGSPVVAQNTADTLNLTVGAGISILNNSGSNTISFTNTGVTALSSSDPNIVLTASTGSINISFDNRIDIIGSVFADDSTMLVDSTNGVLRGQVIGSLTGNVIGDITGSLRSTNTGNLVVDTSSSVAAFTGSFSGPLQGNVVGNVTGNVDGDVSGSVFADDSTMLVDGTNAKIVGPVETTTVAASGYIQTGVYADLAAIGTAIVEPAKGMIVFNDDTDKFLGWDGLAWVELN